MDARKHLRGLGWGGEGHSLGKHANGIKKPLLILHKTGLHGLGAKSQKEKQADQWWLNAFDTALRDIGTGRESALSQVRDGPAKNSLYRFFVRGVGLEGTIEEASSGASTPVEDGCVGSKSIVTLSVKDLPQATEAGDQSGKKDKKAKKEKKRKREEDPVDSHQDEPEPGKKRSKNNRSSATVSEADEASKSEKSESKKKEKKKKSKSVPADESITEALEDAPPKEVVHQTDSDPASATADKKARRKAQQEKRARKEARRLRKEQQDSTDSSEKTRRKEKKDKKKKAAEQAVR